MRNLFLVLSLAAIPAMAADIYTFTVSNPVNVGSPAGIMTGWGYSIHNESSTYWLVTTALTADVFQHATPDNIFDFPDIAPGATVTLPYDPAPPASGLYQILWDSNAPAGFVNSGSFTLSAEWWNGDPLSGGTLVSTAPDVSQPYSATLTPEPATLGSAAIFFSISCAIGFLRRRRSRNSTPRLNTISSTRCAGQDRQVHASAGAAAALKILADFPR